MMDARTAETLRAANLALTQSLTLEVVLERLLDCLSRLVPYDSANVMLLEQGWRLVVQASRGYSEPDKVQGSVWSVAAHAIFRRLVGERGSVLVSDTAADPDWVVHAGAEDVRCWMGVPLLAGRELIGIYAVDKREAGFFGAEHLRLTEALAPQAVIAIRNARLFQKVQQHAAELERNLAELQRADRALRENEQRTSAIIETARDAFVSIDAAGYITGWNRQAELSFGWNRAEVLGRSLAETIIPPAYREAHRAGLSRFLASGTGTMFDRRLELVAQHRDGREIPVELTVSAVRTGPSWVFNAFLRDISERRRDERRRAMQLSASAILTECSRLEEAAPRLLKVVGEGVGSLVAELWARDERGVRWRALWHAPGIDPAAFEEAPREADDDLGWLPPRPLAADGRGWPDLPAGAPYPRDDAAAGMGLRCALLVPVAHAGAPLGLLAFFDRQQSAPDAHLQETLGEVARHLSLFMLRVQAEERIRPPHRADPPAGA
jgi:PAS domain S-box-containing protein